MDYETMRAKVLELNAVVKQMNALMRELEVAGVDVNFWFHRGQKSYDKSEWCIRVSHDIPLEDE
jgi:hypothetical protein